MGALTTLCCHFKGYKRRDNYTHMYTPCYLSDLIGLMEEEEEEMRKSVQQKLLNLREQIGFEGSLEWLQEVNMSNVM